MKTFAENQPVEFKRDTEFRREWERGFYINRGWSGWHWVKAESGDQFLVPARRIRAAVETEKERK